MDAVARAGYALCRLYGTGHSPWSHQLKNSCRTRANVLSQLLTKRLFNLPIRHLLELKASPDFIAYEIDPKRFVGRRESLPVTWG